MTEILVTAFFCLSSAFLLYLASSEYTFCLAPYPSPGIIPGLESIAALSLGLLLLLCQFRAPAPKAAPPETIPWRKLIFFLVGFLTYIITLELFGYIATTFFFLLYLFKVTGANGWRLPTLAAFLSTLFFLFLFQCLLFVKLP